MYTYKRLSNGQSQFSDETGQIKLQTVATDPEGVHFYRLNIGEKELPIGVCTKFIELDDGRTQYVGEILINYAPDVIWDNWYTEEEVDQFKAQGFDLDYIRKKSAREYRFKNEKEAQEVVDVIIKHLAAYIEYEGFENFIIKYSGNVVCRVPDTSD